MPYVTADTSLPRSLDVSISLSRAQAETRTDLSLPAVVLEDLGFFPNENRVRFYSTIEAVEADFAAGTEAHFAASAFFNQTPKADTLAIGEVYLTAQPALLASAVFTAAEITALTSISDGSMDITYNPDTEGSAGPTTISMTGLDFTAVTDEASIASILNAATDSGISVSVKTLPGGNKHVVFTTVATGDNVVVTYPSAGVSGTYVGDLLNLTSAQGGSVMNGYTPTDIGSELTNVFNAANQAGKYIYGWALSADLRDVSIQTTAAAWVLSRTGFMVLTTNDVTAVDPSYSADIGSVVSATGNRRVTCVYHDNAQRYPDVSILAYMLHVDYRLQDSTVTAKFKELPGIETVDVTETEWSTLQEKGYNTYTAIGNDARTYRDGDTSSSSWYMDTVINLDNFVEDLSVAVFNVFLRNKKIPYTTQGQALLVDACRDVGNQYTYNGTFADRETTDSTRKSGTVLVPAVVITPTPIAQSSVADRAARSGPPIAMEVQEAGAIHSVSINVEVVS